MPSRILLACAIWGVATLSAQGEIVTTYVNTNGYFRIDFPADWVSAPKEVVEVANEMLEEYSGQKLAIPNEALFQPAGLQWCTGAYVFVQTNESGPIAEPELKMQTVSAKELWKGLGRAGSYVDIAGDGRTVYDEERKVIVLSAAMTPKGANEVIMISANFLTSKGTVAINFYCPRPELERWKPTFDNMVKSAIVSADYRYKTESSGVSRDAQKLSPNTIKWVTVGIIFVAFAAYKGYRQRKNQAKQEPPSKDT